MIKRSWVARPTSPASSYITALKVSLRPSTAVSSLSQRTIMPTGVGALWASSSLVPTVPQPGSSSGATLCQQAFSTNAARAGVANTFSSPLPMAAAVLAAVTATLALPLIPGFSIVQYSFYQQQFCGGNMPFIIHALLPFEQHICLTRQKNRGIISFNTKEVNAARQCAALPGFVF